MTKLNISEDEMDMILNGKGICRQGVARWTVGATHRGVSQTREVKLTCTQNCPFHFIQKPSAN